MLILVRHGESEGNVAGLLSGRGEWPLTTEGRTQARQLAVELSGSVDRIVSSPIGRARETAEILADGCETDPPELDERWREIDYGRLDGTPLANVPVDLWRQWRRDVDYAPPGGESVAAVGRRVRAACVELAGADGPLVQLDRHLVVVSHVSPIKAAVAWALGVDDLVAWRLHLSPGSMAVVGQGAGGRTLRGYNLRPGRPAVA